MARSLHSALAQLNQAILTLAGSTLGRIPPESRTPMLLSIPLVPSPLSATYSRDNFDRALPMSTRRVGSRLPRSLQACKGMIESRRHKPAPATRAHFLRPGTTIASP